MSAIDHYLGRYAEPEASLAERCAELAPDEQLVVVPSFAEGAGILPTVASLEQAAEWAQVRCRLVIVVNGPESPTPQQAQSNQRSLDVLRERWPRSYALDAGRSFGAAGDRVSVVVIDRCSAGRGLPSGQGVGLARKIGADLALSLLQRKNAPASAVMRFTDADALLPADYLQSIALGDAVAAIYPFVHVKPTDAAAARAIELYELSLRYYVAGLRFAGSPYAFHTVGSTLAVTAGGYAAVRGVPRRQAAEDFYLLNKLAKTGPVLALADRQPIELDARRSDRVPFGTGAMMNRMSAGADLLFYDPQLFVVLKQLLQRLPLTEQPLLEPLSRVASKLADELKQLRRLADHPNQRQVLRQQQVYFDAWKTLQLIHRGRDLAFPSLPWRTAVQQAPFFSQCSASLSEALAAATALDYRAVHWAGIAR
ncbi:MAG: hypothetical protein H6707_06275 [Deltaproteobacteria bacterium]|nr:hypothetical protein [Deltaproteobacteria bacterium]